MIKCVIFDFDGTLVKSNEIKIRVFYEVTKDLVGADSILDKILSRPSTGDRYSVFDLLIADLNLSINSFVDASQLLNSYTSICENEISRAPETKGAKKTLEELKKIGTKVVISSATPKDTLKKIVDMRGWMGMIDIVLGSPNSKFDHIQTILEKNKYSISDIVYVGDSEVDREAALSVGCKFIAIGVDWSRFISRPDTILENLENFTKELKL